MAPARESQVAETAVSVPAVPTLGPQVTVVRTESHLARFNNARALFEKLGEEARPLHRVEKSPSTGGVSSSVVGSLSGRSRSSSAGSRAGKLSRSPSPPKPDLLPRHSYANASNKNGIIENDRPLNGNVETNNVRSSKTEYRVMNANGSVKDSNRVKPLILAKKPEKPEKPERKFNSKELIEKQRNWTSHFSKQRTSRAPSEVSKSDSKTTSGVVSVNRDERSGIRSPGGEAVQSGIRSPFRSPPTSPPPLAATPSRILSPPLVESVVNSPRSPPAVVTPTCATSPRSPSAVTTPIGVSSPPVVASPSPTSPKYIDDTTEPTYDTLLPSTSPPPVEDEQEPEVMDKDETIEGSSLILFIIQFYFVRLSLQNFNSHMRDPT